MAHRYPYFYGFFHSTIILGCLLFQLFFRGTAKPNSGQLLAYSEEV